MIFAKLTRFHSRILPVPQQHLSSTMKLPLHLFNHRVRQLSTMASQCRPADPPNTLQHNAKISMIPEPTFGGPQSPPGFRLRVKVDTTDEQIGDLEKFVDRKWAEHKSGPLGFNNKDKSHDLSGTGRDVANNFADSTSSPEDCPIYQKTVQWWEVYYSPPLEMPDERSAKVKYIA